MIFIPLNCITFQEEKGVWCAQFKVKRKCANKYLKLHKKRTINSTLVNQNSFFFDLVAPGTSIKQEDGA